MVGRIKTEIIKRKPLLEIGNETVIPESLRIGEMNETRGIRNENRKYIYIVFLKRRYDGNKFDTGNRITTTRIRYSPTSTRRPDGRLVAGVRRAVWARRSPGRRPPGTGSRRTLCRHRTWPPCRCGPGRFPTWPWCAGAASTSCSGTGPAGASFDVSRTACAPSPRPLRRTTGTWPPVPFCVSLATRTGWARYGSATTVGRATASLSCTPATADNYIIITR